MSYTTDEFDGRVVELLNGGAVGFMPSDTIYGLSAKALDEAAVRKVHGLKDRQTHKPFIVLIADLQMLNKLSIDIREGDVAKGYWPGGLTLICQAPDSPAWLQLGTRTLAVRIPDFPELRQLISSVGPLISTSANIENSVPAKSSAEAQAIFGDQLDFYVDVGELSSQPSTLAKSIGGKLQVIRQGAVKIKP